MKTSGQLRLISRITSIILFLTVIIYSFYATGYLHVFVIGIIYLAANLAAYLNVILNPHRGGVSFMYYFFFTFFVALPAAIQVKFQVFPGYVQFSVDELARAYAILALAQLSYVIAEFRFDQRWQRSYQKARNFGSVVNSKFYWYASAFFGLICISIIIYLGPDILFLTRGERGQELMGEGISQQLLFIGRSLSLLMIIIALYLSQHRSFRSNRSLYSISSIVFLVIFFVLNYPPGLARFQLMGAVIAISAVFVNFFKSRIKIAGSIAAILFLLFLFPTIKQFGQGTADNFWSEAMNRESLEYLRSVDFDAFKQTANTGIYLENGSYRWGYNFLGVALFFVPRSIWPAKPVDSGYLVSSDLGYAYTNVGNPLPAEALISFGYPGIILVFYLLSIAICKMELIVSKINYRDSLYQSAFVYCLTMGFITIILRGALNAVAPQFATGFLAFFVLKFLHDKTTIPKIL